MGGPRPLPFSWFLALLCPPTVMSASPQIQDYNPQSRELKSGFSNRNLIISDNDFSGTKDRLTPMASRTHLSRSNPAQTEFSPVLELKLGRAPEHGVQELRNRIWSTKSSGPSEVSGYAGLKGQRKCQSSLRFPISPSLSRLFPQTLT